MYQIDDFEYIYILTLLPLIWICFGLLLRWKKKVQMSFSRPELLEILSPNRSKFKPIFKLIVLSVSLFLLVIALMNPKIGTQLETVKEKGRYRFAIDVSKSMLAEDIAPNRIEKSKRLVSAILNQLASDRVGIIAYAAQAVPQLP